MNAIVGDRINEYLAMAEVTTRTDYADKKSVRRHNAACKRMRAIVDEVVALGQEAVQKFASLLDREPASLWVAHQLVEMAELDQATLSRCFDRVERAKWEAEASGNRGNAMGEEWWLRDWRAKKAKCL